MVFLTYVHHFYSLGQVSEATTQWRSRWRHWRVPGSCERGNELSCFL